jgi:hypothetical protein
MKKVYLSVLGLMMVLFGLGQSTPDNVDVGLFNNGAHGSNGSSGANVEVALRIKPGGTSYTAVPAAEDFVMYFFVPKADFAISDVINIVQTNTSIYGATGTMTFQGFVDIGDPNYLYCGIVLNAAGGMNLSSLSSVTNAWSFAYTISFTPTKTSAQYNNLRIVDQTNNGFLSGVFGSTTYTTLQMSTQNQLTSTALSTLPVSLLNFSGYKSVGKNTLKWTTSSEQNNRGFEIQRSSDGVNYGPIGFVNSQAIGGTSSTNLSYSFDDNNPSGQKQYYRLKQQDLDGNSKLSNIVLITRDKPTSLSLAGLFPNPTREKLNVIIETPQRDRVTVVVTDMTGKIVKQQLETVDVGSNTVLLDVARLASGSYLVKLVCQSGDCQMNAAQFNKE